MDTKRSRVGIFYVFTLFSTLATTVLILFLNRGPIEDPITHLCRFTKSIQPIPEPSFSWHHYSAHYVNVTVILHSFEPLYMIKVFEALVPKETQTVEVVFTTDEEKKKFTIDGCASGVEVYRRFLAFEWQDLPLELNVSLILNR